MAKDDFTELAKKKHAELTAEIEKLQKQLDDKKKELHPITVYLKEVGVIEKPKRNRKKTA